MFFWDSLYLGTSSFPEGGQSPGVVGGGGVLPAQERGPVHFGTSPRPELEGNIARGYLGFWVVFSGPDIQDVLGWAFLQALGTPTAHLPCAEQRLAMALTQEEDSLNVHGCNCADVIFFCCRFSADDPLLRCYVQCLGYPRRFPPRLSSWCLVPTPTHQLVPWHGKPTCFFR